MGGNFYHPFLLLTYYNILSYYIVLNGYQRASLLYY
jgi:hypothetical protein